MRIWRSANSILLAAWRLDGVLFFSGDISACTNARLSALRLGNYRIKEGPGTAHLKRLSFRPRSWELQSP